MTALTVLRSDRGKGLSESGFANPYAAIADIAEIVRPPRRMRPSEAAAAYLRNEKGAWSPELAPMMVEPLDLLGSRDYTGILFVGPQRTGKTFGLIHAGMTYIVTCAPGDTLVLQMSQDTARDFSRMEVDRVIRHSPALTERLSPRARDDNTFDKFFRSGMALKFGWPAISQLSGKTLKYVLMTDYDRPENRDDVGGEGPMWDLGHKRVQTYMSRGKCLAESSPGDPYDDPRWIPRSAHEAPPARGILELYNRGTRARWYWPCLHCGEYWEPKPGLAPFDVPDFDDCLELVQREDPMTLAARYARVVHRDGCGATAEMDRRRAMNAWGTWVHEGQQARRLEPRELAIDVVTRDLVRSLDLVHGDRRETPFASFWMGGAAAPYQRWDGLLYQYFQAVQTYARTGDEGPLQTTTSSDQGAAYLPRAAGKRRTPEEFTGRVEDWQRGVVPAGVRFLVAVVDVQAHRFVVQVHGFGLGLQSWVVERFSITASNRREDDKFAGLDPASYVEDWEVLLPQVLDRAYRLEGKDQAMRPLIVGSDSGGKEGVTEKAYEFYRRLRTRRLHDRFRLLKGTGNLNAPRTNESWPDSRGRKDRDAGARGDVPVWLLNVNVLKDGVAGDLARIVPGPGYVHIPRWIDAEYFQELTAETRTAKGWETVANVRNEAADLHGYARALCVMIGAEAVDWNKPPPWAAEWDRNTQVISLEQATKPAPPAPTRQRRIRNNGIQ